MKTSIIWENQPQDRKEYIAEWLKDAVGFREGMTESQYENKLKSFSQTSLKNWHKLTLKQINAIHLLNGEKHKDKLISGSFKIINKYSESKPKDSNYKKVYENYYKSESLDFKKLKITKEKFLISGKAFIRYRDNKTGRFIKYKE